MAGRSHKESASESESRQPTNSRASNKARNTAAQAAQQEFLLKHINSNGPQDKPKPHPLDFNSLSDEALEKYNKKYDLDYPAPLSINGHILSSEIGKKTFTAKNISGNKISKPELSNNLKKHFLALPCRENEIIANFIYKVNNQEKDFKLSFK